MIVPIMHCFDNNYVIPAAVAFFSLVKNSNPENHYLIYVLHNDITQHNQVKLISTVAKFKNAEIIFINMNDRFDDLFSQTKIQGHYTKEMFYKFLAPSLFPQHKKIMISDVDVVYLNDISENYSNFKNLDDYYFAGCKGLINKDAYHDNVVSEYRQDFSENEIEKLTTGAGYYVFNLEKMRSDNIESKFIEFAHQHAKRIRQPEQDVINLICHPKIWYLPANSMVCSYAYDMYPTEQSYATDLNYSASEVSWALQNPVQLHFATKVKPWNTPNCTQSAIWHHYLFQTPFGTDHLETLQKHISLGQSKTVLDWKVPFSARNRIVIKKTRSKQ